MVDIYRCFFINMRYKKGMSLGEMEVPSSAVSRGERDHVCLHAGSKERTQMFLPVHWAREWLGRRLGQGVTSVLSRGRRTC